MLPTQLVIVKLNMEISQNNKSKSGYLTRTCNNNITPFFWQQKIITSTFKVFVNTIIWLEPPKKRHFQLVQCNNRTTEVVCNQTKR